MGSTLPKPKEIAAWSEKFSPHRSYLALILWALRCPSQKKLQHGPKNFRHIARISPSSCGIYAAQAKRNCSMVRKIFATSLVSRPHLVESTLPKPKEIAAWSEKFSPHRSYLA